MKPYYETENGKLYHGDCLNILPELKPVDLVLTDPPYGMNYRSNYRKVKYDKIIGDNSLPINLIKMSINKAIRCAYIFCRWNNLQDMPTPKSVLVWIKNNWTAGDLKHEHGRKWEACNFYPKQQHQFIKRISDVLYSQKTDNKLHPTQKPVGLLMQIIQCNVCDMVLDPFLGSGTTAIACERLNKKWIGIEKEEKYCRVAVQRLKNERAQLKLW